MLCEICHLRPAVIRIIGKKKGIEIGAGQPEGIDVSCEPLTTPAICAKCYQEETGSSLPGMYAPRQAGVNYSALLGVLLFLGGSAFIAILIWGLLEGWKHVGR